MGDRVRGSTPGAGPETSFGHPGQLSLAILPWVGVMIEYKPKGGDALWLGSKDKYGL